MRENSKSWYSKFMLCAKVAAGVFVLTILSTKALGAESPVDLASASGFAVLAGTTVTNTGAAGTTVNGDLGVWPGTAVTGFPPGILVGTLYAGGPVAQAAQSDLTTAYNDAAGRTTAPVLVAGNLGGQTLPPGLYKSTSSLEITSGDLTLDGQGDANAVWIFQMASTLTTTADRSVSLINGARASNIFWQVGSSATFGIGSTFEGTVMALESITLNTNAVINGRSMALNGAVTLDATVATKPEPVPGLAHLRVLHISPDAPEADVLVDQDNVSRLVEDLAFQKGTEFFEFDAGAYDLDFVPTGANHGESFLRADNLLLDGDTFYTVAAYDMLASASTIVLIDDQTPPAAGNMRLRAIHTATGLGQVDLWNFTDVMNPTALYENISFGTASSASEVSAQAYRLGLDLDNDSIPEHAYSLPALAAGEIANIFVVEDDTTFLLVQLSDGTTIRLTPADTDRDGLYDSAEIALGTNLNSKHSDGDGVEDGVEVAIGTDPLDSADPPVTTDNDGDGVPDYHELLVGSSSFEIDSDGDGITDMWETVRGTDPNDPGSHPFFGDTDMVNGIDFLDAVLVFQIFLGNKDASDYAPPETIDINRDGKVDSVDGVILMNYYLGNIPHIPFP